MRVRLPLRSMYRPLSKRERCLGFQSGRILIPIVCFILLGMLILISMSTDEEARLEPGSKSNPIETRHSGDLVLSVINGSEVLWQIPDSAKAILFLAHGCNGRAGNFWSKSPSCPNCVGLPEEIRIVAKAIDKQFAVLAISSSGRCWNLKREDHVVKSIISWWISKHNLENLPLVALGASSGGYFVSKLALTVKFSSICVMIAEGVFDQIEVDGNYPPTLFVHMPKDGFRFRKISEFLVLLKNKGVESKEVRSLEIPLTRTFFSDRIEEINEILSAKLFELFRDRGFINGSGYMKHDGRATRWKEALVLHENVQLDEKLFQHVEEELNLAFGFHEMTSLNLDDIFRWFDSHLN